MFGRAARFSRVYVPRGVWFVCIGYAVLRLVEHWRRAPGPAATEGVPLAFEYLTLERTTPEHLLVAAVLAAGLIWLIARVPRGRGGAAARGAWALPCLYAACFFYYLRDVHNDLGDGRALLRDPTGVVRDGGYYTFLDEVAGMWLPVRLAQWLHARGAPAGDALLQAYRAVSVGSGVLFVGAITLAGRHVRQRHLFVTLLVVSAPNRLFAGYVENYPTCAALLGCVFLLAADDLRRRADTTARVLLVAVLSALAVGFHAVAVWSVFGLAYFALVRRGPFRAPVATASRALLAGLVTLLALFLVFWLYLTPGVGFVHANHLPAQIPDVLRDRTLAEHAMALGHVALPALVLLGASTLAAPHHVLPLLRERDVRFALLWLLGFVVHQAIWPSTLGLAQDWDLFSFTWLPLAYVAWRATSVAVCRVGRDPDGAIVAFTFALCALGGLSWIATAMG